MPAKVIEVPLIRPDPSKVDIKFLPAPNVAKEDRIRDPFFVFRQEYKRQIVYNPFAPGPIRYDVTMKMVTKTCKGLWDSMKPEEREVWRAIAWHGLGPNGETDPNYRREMRRPQQPVKLQDLGVEQELRMPMAARHAFPLPHGFPDNSATSENWYNSAPVYAPVQGKMTAPYVSELAYALRRDQGKSKEEDIRVKEEPQ